MSLFFSSRLRALFALALLVLSVGQTSAVGAESALQAQQIIEAVGVKGGFIVHLGCGNGELTKALPGQRALPNSRLGPRSRKNRRRPQDPP